MSKYRVPRVDTHGGSSSEDEDEDEEEEESSSEEEIEEQEASESSEKQTECSTGEEDDSTTKGGGGGSQSQLKTSQMARGKSATTPLKRQLSGKNSMFELKKRVKREMAEEEGNVGEGNCDGSKRVLFQRLWSEDDEIALLNGMIEYEEKRKRKGWEELNDFLDFVKNSLHVNVNKAQLSDKIRRLRKKYRNNARKDEAGKFSVSWKVHEKKSYELSKKLWGGEGGGVMKEERKKDIVGASGRSNPESKFYSISILHEKRKKLMVREIELFLKRIEFEKERTKLVLEELKSSG